MSGGKPLFDHFGLLAPLYERVIRHEDVATLRRMLDPRPTDLLLDVGGGTGRIAQHFREDVAHICVVDLSWGMLWEARAKAKLGVCQGRVERLPFRDGAFPRIIAVDSFHHFQDYARGAGELVRVLAPGGRLVIEEPDVRRFPVKLVAWAERLALMRSHFYPPGALMRFFGGPGLRVSLHEDTSVNFWLVVEKMK